MTVQTASTQSSSGARVGPHQARLVTFFDGQNLFGAAKRAYGYMNATYDPVLLSRHVAGSLSAALTEIRFYTGVHTQAESPALWSYWNTKIGRMRSSGVNVFHRNLAYHTEEFTLPDGSTVTRRVPREKGIDIRIALDMVRLVRENALDTIVLFSQDNDLREACDEVKMIAQSQGRFVRIRSAFPQMEDPAKATKQRGIEKTEWHPIARSVYDSCCEAPGGATGAPISAFGAALQAALAKPLGTS
jgi:uncharacterized LabA/DUF88 family protein